MQEPSPSEARRLHVAAIPVWAVDNLKRLGIGLIGILAVSGPERPFLLALAAVGVVAPVIRYVRFSYRISGETLVVEGGLVPRWRRVIPLARIQSVDRVQKLLHRTFGVVQLRVEAAGGTGTEADLVALAPAEAERIRSLLLERGGRAEEVPGPGRPPLARLTTKDLLLAGTTGGRVAVLAAMLVYLQEVLPGDIQERIFGSIGTADMPPPVLIVLAVAGFLFVSLLVSIIATVFVYWNFTLRREDERLVVERGLLDQRRSTVPLHRVQAVVLHENLVRRALGLASLSVIVAGYGGPREEQEETSMLLPISRRDEALSLAAQVLGAPAEVASARLEPAPARARIPRIARGCVAGVVAGIAGLVVVGPLGALGFLLCVPGALVALGTWRSLGHSLIDDHAVVRSGWSVRKTSFVPLANIQELKLTHGPIQHLYGLASVRLRVPRSEPAALDLDRSLAEERFSTLARAMIA